MNNHVTKLRGTQERAIGALPQPYLLFLGDVTEPGYAKTAFGLRDWAEDLCIGEYAVGNSAVSLGLKRMSPAEARSKGARAMVIGVANSGGIIPLSWNGALVEALEAGLDLVSGMHMKLYETSRLPALAEELGRLLIDIRVPPPQIPIATGMRRGGKRLLTVGTDCAVGKKYTALAIARGMRARGVDADFRATGQTGIMIAGAGIPMDAVVSDFLSGAAEMLSPDASAGHWDVIEGQGSLFHPAYAAVTLGLLHGSQPDVFIVCHEPGRTKMLGIPDYTLPTIESVIAQTIATGKLTNTAIRCAGVSLNTSTLTEAAAEVEIAATESRLGLPVADPVRGGEAMERLINACLA